MRYVDRITRESKSDKCPKPYQLSMFTDVLTGDNDDREDIREAMEKGICLSAWMTLFNVIITKRMVRVSVSAIQ